MDRLLVYLMIGILCMGYAACDQDHSQNDHTSRQNRYMDMVHNIARGRLYYHMLGVDQDATPQEIKKAYRQMALKYHPDKNKEANAAKVFQSITEANEILSDPDLRKQYDDLLRDGIPMMDRYYNRHVHSYGLPKHDIRLVLTVLLGFLTIIKYLSDRSNYNTMCERVKQSPNYKHYIRTHGLQSGEGFRFVDLEPPSWRTLLPVQLIKLPFKICYGVYWHTQYFIRWRWLHPPRSRSQVEAMLKENGATDEMILAAKQRWGARIFGPEDEPAPKSKRKEKNKSAESKADATTTAEKSS